MVQGLNQQDMKEIIIYKTKDNKEKKMSAWGNTDNHNQKPKWVVERENREYVQLVITSGNTAGNNMITVAYNDGAQNNVANVGVQAGQYVYFMANGFAAPGGTAGNGYPGFFASNTTVQSVSGNTVTLTNALFNTVSVGFGVEFDKAIVYNTNKAPDRTYNQDTVLVTPTPSPSESVAPTPTSTSSLKPKVKK